MKIYIACALTHVPRPLFAEYSAFIHALAAALVATEPPHQVKYALVDSDPQLATKPRDERARLCYLWDREMVGGAELLIAEASFPSTGLGIELEIAAQKSTPIIMCYRNFGNNQMAPISYRNPDESDHDLQIGDGFITLMALGIPSVLKAIQYSDAADGIAKILGSVALIDR